MLPEFKFHVSVVAANPWFGFKKCHLVSHHMFWMGCDTLVTDPLHGLSLNIRECWLKGVITVKSRRNNWVVDIGEMTSKGSCLAPVTVGASTTSPLLLRSCSWSKCVHWVTKTYMGGKDRWNSLMGIQRQRFSLGQLNVSFVNAVEFRLELRRVVSVQCCLIRSIHPFSRLLIEWGSRLGRWLYRLHRLSCTMDSQSIAGLL